MGRKGAPKRKKRKVFGLRQFTGWAPVPGGQDEQGYEMRFKHASQTYHIRHRGDENPVAAIRRVRAGKNWNRWRPGMRMVWEVQLHIPRVARHQHRSTHPDLQQAVSKGIKAYEEEVVLQLYTVMSCDL
jgi:hypothetical protein